MSAFKRIILSVIVFSFLQMNRHSKLGKGRKDMYYYLAKESGFRSRAAFKLLQLEKKFGFLQNSQTCLDLCAAPGGWSYVAVKNMPVGSRVIAVDLDPIKPIPGVTSFYGDITTYFTSDTIKKLLDGALIDVCVHDGAPNATGDYSYDSYNYNVLVLWALKLACRHLKKGGTFVSKVFRTSEFLQLYYVFKKLFDEVETTKPRSSRDTSAEIFTVCRGYKNADVPESLFDPNIVLRTDSGPAVQNLKALADKLDMRVRHRSGYDTDLVKRYCDMVSFVVSAQPIALLGYAGEICFVDDISTDYRFSDVRDKITTETIKFNRRDIGTLEEYSRIYEIIRKLTPADIQALFSDIKVLSKKDLRDILKWRETVLSEVCAYTVVAEIAELRQFTEQNDEADKENANPVALYEEHMRGYMLKRYKQAIRRARKLERRQAKRLANFDAYNVDDNVTRDADMFYMGDVKFGQILEEVQEPEEASGDEENEQNPDIVRIGKEEINMQLDQQRYFDELDENMEIYYENYQNYKKKKEKHIAELHEIEMKAAGRADIDYAAELWFKQQEFAQKETHEEQEYGDYFPLPKDTLMKTRAHDKRVKTMAREARELRKQNRGLEELREEHREEHRIGDIDREEQRDFTKQWQKMGVTPQPIELMARHYMTESDSDDYDYDEETQSNEEEQNGEVAEVAAPAQENQPADSKKKPIGILLAKQNLESTATKMALAKCLTTKKGRRELEDSAYNRNTFYVDDYENLPKWFLEDEREHNYPVRPLTSEEIQEIKQKLAELNYRPRTKKEREAIARKRQRAHIKMSALYERTQQIINREDLTEREKVKQLKKMQAAIAQKAPKKRVVYSNLHKELRSRGKLPHNVKLIDKRGKKDIRQAKIRANRGY